LCLDGANTGTIRLLITGEPAEDVPFPATGTIDLTETYYVSGDGGPTDLVKMLEDALSGNALVIDFFVTEDGEGEITINGDADFKIDGDHANTTVDLTTWGMDNSGDHPPIDDQVYVVPRLAKGGFFPGEQPDDDPLPALPIIAGASVSLAGDTRVIKLEREIGSDLTLVWRALDAVLVRQLRATSTYAYANFERGWIESISEGHPFRYYEDATVDAYQVYRVSPESLGPDHPWTEADEAAIFWDVKLKAIGVDV